MTAPDEVRADDLDRADRRVERGLLVDEQADAEGGHGFDHVLGGFVVVVAEDRDAAIGDGPERREGFFQATRGAHALHGQEVARQRDEIRLALDQRSDPVAEL